jgi:hypothetical protein
MILEAKDRGALEEVLARQRAERAGRARPADGLGNSRPTRRMPDVMKASLSVNKLWKWLGDSLAAMTLCTSFLHQSPVRMKKTRCATTSSTCAVREWRDIHSQLVSTPLVSRVDSLEHQTCQLRTIAPVDAYGFAGQYGAKKMRKKTGNSGARGISHAIPAQS